MSCWESEYPLVLWGLFCRDIHNIYMHCFSCSQRCQYSFLATKKLEIPIVFTLKVIRKDLLILFFHIAKILTLLLWNIHLLCKHLKKYVNNTWFRSKVPRIPNFYCILERHSVLTWFLVVCIYGWMTFWKQPQIHILCSIRACWT